MTRGFSLIETIIYIALLGFIMSGAVITAYQVTQSSSVVSGKNVSQEEGSFVLRKLEQAFVGSADVWENAGSLVIDPYPAGPGDYITISVSGDTVFIKRGAGNTVELTTDNVTADFEFSVHASPPKGVTATTTVDGVPFVMTKYVR
jgi:type II secretory pathway pseudopilin PulG